MAIKCFFNGCDELVCPDSIKCLRHKRKGICRVDQCRNQVNKRGLCIGHGARDACIVPGCVSLGRSAGLCSKHSKLSNSSPCAVENCRRRVKDGAICAFHVSKLKYQSTVQAVKDPSHLVDPSLTWTVGDIAISSLDDTDSSLFCSSPINSSCGFVSLIGHDDVDATSSDPIMHIDQDNELPTIEQLLSDVSFSADDQKDSLTWMDLVGEAPPAWLGWKPPILLKDICKFVDSSSQDHDGMIKVDEFEFIPLDGVIGLGC
ncbi:hypothetical protein AC1031_006931 [Aphanomyces cochlioides]|nr:hypothetical protein AC1031_006931 [Aphanomyces cochlioides]